MFNNTGIYRKQRKAYVFHIVGYQYYIQIYPPPPEIISAYRYLQRAVSTCFLNFHLNFDWFILQYINDIFLDIDFGVKGKFQ